MDVRQLEWDDANAEHIARHSVVPEEVEEVCFEDEPLFIRVGPGRYQVTGQTASGRYLTAFLDHLGRGRFYPVTARPATEGERRLCRKRNGR
jgi:uncharacterized DUF497 family protein